MTQQSSQSWFVVFLALMFAGLIFILSRREGKARRVWFIVTLGVLPLAVLATGICLFVAGYVIGDRLAVPGASAGLTIALAEVFAVSFEAVALYLLARKTFELAFRQAAVISVLANLSSFLIGLLAAGWL